MYMCTLCTLMWFYVHLCICMCTSRTFMRICVHLCVYLRASEERNQRLVAANGCVHLLKCLYIFTFRWRHIVREMLQQIVMEIDAYIHTRDVLRTKSLRLATANGDDVVRDESRRLATCRVRGKHHLWDGAWAYNHVYVHIYISIYAYVSTAIHMIFVRIYIHMRPRARAANRHSTYIQHGGVQWYALSAVGTSLFKKSTRMCVYDLLFSFFCETNWRTSAIIRVMQMLSGHLFKWRTQCCARVLPCWNIVSLSMVLAAHCPAPTRTLKSWHCPKHLRALAQVSKSVQNR